MDCRKPQTRHWNRRWAMRGFFGESTQLLDTQVADILSLLEATQARFNALQTHQPPQAWMMTQRPLLQSPLLLLRVIGGLLNGPSSGDEGCFIRSGSPEPGAHMNPLDIYSSSLCRFCPVCVLSLPPPPPRGPDGLSADILRRDIPSSIVSI